MLKERSDQLTVAGEELSRCGVATEHNFFGVLLESSEPARAPETRKFGRIDTGGFDGTVDPRW